MGKRSFGVMLIAVFIMVLVSGAFTTKAGAAAKPKVSKSRVTLSVDSDKYTIELKNIADDAKITYTSSDRSVITVKKGVVTPEKAGKASVKIKVKQNKKTFKLKVVFTVKEAEKKDTDKNTGSGNDDYSAEVVRKSTESSLFSDERKINEAISSGSTGKLSTDEKALYDKVISLAKKLKGKSEYETVKNIHDHLVSNIAYPQSWSGNGVHSLNYALNKGGCVCDGYAKAFYFLCKADGIESMIVGGTATDEYGTESHAWNKVKVNGKWYTIDVTWDDPFPDDPGVVRYDYFLITDEDIARNHKWDDKGIPDAYSDDLGLIYEKYKDIEKFEKTSDALKNFRNRATEFLLDANNRGTSKTLEFLVYTADTSFANTVTSQIEEYYKTYRCGFEYSFESAGFYGMYFRIKLIQ